MVASNAAAYWEVATVEQDHPPLHPWVSVTGWPVIENV
jgi:hypothetical protein